MFEKLAPIPVVLSQMSLIKVAYKLWKIGMHGGLWDDEKLSYIHHVIRQNNAQLAIYIKSHFSVISSPVSKALRMLAHVECTCETGTS